MILVETNGVFARNAHEAAACMPISDIRWHRCWTWTTFASHRSTHPPSLLQVSLAQKWMLQRARLAGKPGLVAGQVMESMAASPRPSRPEITDVVNAVYDGADGIVLMQVSEPL
jgi:hypothetical protein